MNGQTSAPKCLCGHHAYHAPFIPFRSSILCNLQACKGHLLSTRRHCCQTVTTCQSETQPDSHACRRSLLALGVVGLCVTQRARPADAETALPPELRKALQGPVQFLKARQRANGGEFLMSPIKVSRKRLETAMQVLERQNVYEPDLLIYRTALSMVRSASLNCYVFDAEKNDTIETRMSLLQRQLGIGDACTFRLIEKNVTSLLPKSKEQLKEDAKTSLSDLLRSYRKLDDVLYRAYGGDIFAAEEAVNSLQYTISSTASFQTIIEACLQVSPTKPVAKDLTVG